MPKPQTPGTYIEETRLRPPVAPAPVGVAAFVGHTLSGPINQVVPVKSFLEFSNAFGGLAASSEVSYAVLQFFRNGGDKALIVRVPELETGLPGLGMISGATSSFPMGLGCLEANDEFGLLCVPDAVRPRAPGGSVSQFSVEKIAEFWRIGMDLCRRKRAMALVDMPADATTRPAIEAFLTALPRESGAFAAVYAPWILIDDPLQDGQQRPCPPCGSAAGVIARAQKTLGPWKLPTGAMAQVRNVRQLARRFTDAEETVYGPLGLNLLRDFADRGILVWGTRTLSLSEEWNRLSERELGSFIERSVSQAMDWTALEPNGEKLWAAIRASIEAFMETLRQRGAFAGTKPDQSWFVKCDRSTMTQADIDAGRALVLIGYAPHKAGEFITLQIQIRSALPQE